MYNSGSDVLAHTKLVKDSKQAMATTSTLLRYTTVVAPEVDADAVAVAAVQGPSSVTLQVANNLPKFPPIRLASPSVLTPGLKRRGLSYQLLPQQPSLLLRLR